MALFRLRIETLSVLLSLGMSGTALANHLCVNPMGSSGCYTTIGAAVSAALAGDEVDIGAGEYNEGVVITKPLSLVGAGADASIINAKGQANGIYIDGLDNSGLFSVLVTGLTVSNANFEGILVTNASSVVIAQNHVVGNDQALNYAAGTCLNQPAFETNEGMDCGEGIHLVGVTFATIANNEVEMNSGGILLSDETGQTYENVITSNSVHDNALDCGITLASHAPSPQASSKIPYGVFSNTISNNSVMRNGLVGAGAGVGIFAPGPGNLAFSNKVIGNVIMNNGQPGVTVHNHAVAPGAPSPNLNGNVIMHNYIAGNHADTGQTATPGTAGINIFSLAPIYAMEISENTIQDEDNDVVFNSPGALDVHLNNLLGSGTGVADLGDGQVNATINYFGCPGGPGTAGCTKINGVPVNSSAPLGTPVGSAPTGPRKSL